MVILMHINPHEGDRVKQKRDESQELCSVSSYSFQKFIVLADISLKGLLTNSLCIELTSWSLLVTMRCTFNKS